MHLFCPYGLFRCMKLDNFLNYLIFSAALLSRFAITTAYADEFSMFDEEFTTDIARIPQSIADITGRVDIMDRDVIALSGARNLQELLEEVPGVICRRRGSCSLYDSSRWPRHLEVSINGQSIYNHITNIVHWWLYDIELDTIERIETYATPSSSVRGVNAFYGAINIVLRQGYDNQLTVKYANKPGASLIPSPVIPTISPRF